MASRSLFKKAALALVIGVLIGVGFVLFGTPREQPAAPPESPAPPARTPAAKLAAEALDPELDKLKPLFTLKGKPESGDWLDAHHEEPQTWAAFHAEHRSRVSGVIAIQPVGLLSESQRRIVTEVADYMHRFLGLQVTVLPALGSEVIPNAARRKHPTTEEPQLLTSAVATQVLFPRRPENAAAYLAFTGEDLYPGEGWNFVFGQAFPEDRIGLWSLSRFGDPDDSPAAYQLTLARTMKVAVHETAHLLGLEHCQAFECVMNGTNSLFEMDRQTHLICPICLQKLTSITPQSAGEHLVRMKEFFGAHQMVKELLVVEQELQVVIGSVEDGGRWPRRFEQAR